MKKILLILTVVFSLYSCENFLGDINELQDNRADFENLSPDKLLAGPLNSYYSLHSITYNTYGNKMVYAWGLNTGYTTNDPAYTYQYSSSSYSANFESTYLIADNFQDILDKQEKFPDYSYHFGIAKLFRVMSFDYLTALYGDIPYSQSLNDLYPTPVYEDDKAIIPQLFAELDEAREFFNNPSENVVDLGTEDIVFHGDVSSWLKLINTVELRLALRLSKTTDASLVALRNQRFAALNSNQDFITTDVTVNPGFNSIYYQRNPIFRTHGLAEGDAAWTSTNRAHAAGDYAARLLNGTINDANITTGIVDPRRSRIFTLVGTGVVGNVQGVFPATAISRYATFYFGRIGADATAANNNGSVRDGYLFQAAESYFLQAEAYQRGYLTGSAQTAFNNGINASFNFYSRYWGSLTATNIPALNASSYISSIDSKNGLGWTGSSDKISAIMTQKYLALINWNGIDLYIDHMRTGYPVLPLPFGAIKPNRPNRLIYPSSEYSSNSANVPNVINDDLFTVNSKTPYYLQ